MMGVEFSQVLPFGIGFGVFIGTILFCLRLIPHKVITNSVVFQDKETFLSRLKLALAKVSYHSKSETDKLWMWEYKGGDFWEGRLVLENISIQIEESSATITGPKSVIETLQQELSEKHFVVMTNDPTS